MFRGEKTDFLFGRKKGDDLFAWWRNVKIREEMVKVIISL